MGSSSPSPAMRLFLLFALVGLAGCGTLVPYSLTPSWLAPDMVPERGASEIVLLQESAPEGVVTGRVIDLDTGQPLADALVTADDQRAETDADGRFRIPRATRLRVESVGYRPAESAVEGPNTVLVLLSAEPATDA